MLVQDKEYNIDYICDRRAETLRTLNNIPVVNIEKLKTKVEESKKRATIIICVTNKSTVTSIYRDLTRIDINADVFDYFENEAKFIDKIFYLDGKQYDLFQHSYNCGYVQTRMTERSVELALAEEYIINCNETITEIGAVTPYYFYYDKINEIIDPTDTHKRVTQKSLFDCNLYGKNVLSISTIEHIGTSDYGMHERQNVIDAIEKIVSESASCLITAPLGYNNLLDKWVKENQNNKMVKLLLRRLNNHWKEITGDYREIEYTPLWASGLVLIRK